MSDTIKASINWIRSLFQPAPKPKTIADVMAAGYARSWAVFAHDLARDPPSKEEQ